MVYMNFIYYCLCYGFVVIFCFLFVGGKIFDVNDRIFVNVMRSFVLDREKVFLFYRRKNIVCGIELMEIRILIKKIFIVIFFTFIN